MQRRHQPLVASASWAWPLQNSRHAGLLDLGMLGGAYLHPSSQTFRFAWDNQEFAYLKRSPLKQMLPRVRPWTPRPIEQWPQEYNFVAVDRKLNESISYLNSAHTEHWVPEDLLFETMKEDGYKDYTLTYYDPFMGNVCATGHYLNLPAIATPGGPTGASLDIMLLQHTPEQQPPFNMLAPRMSLVDFASPICQISAPSSRSSVELEEQFLIRTREHVSIIAAPHDVPDAISRIEPEYVRIVDRIPSRPSSCRDLTIHAAISPHIPNSYALVGDKGRIALWTRHPAAASSNHDTEPEGDDDDSTRLSDYTGKKTRRDPLQGLDLISLEFEGMSWRPSDFLDQVAMHKEQASAQKKVSQDWPNLTVIRKEDTSQDEGDDPWRRCAWSPHPQLLVVASRKSMELLDFRATATQTNLFTPRTGETIRAIQEEGPLTLAPFQTYIATSHQIACIDQRFAKTPLISWAHHRNRSMPSGIMAMDLVTDNRNYTTVMTWEKRNADITAYNVFLGSNDSEPQPLRMEGRAQELPSFHSHSQYTSSSSLRNPSKVWNMYKTADGQLQQSVKPPLLGLGVMATSLLAEGEHSEGLELEAVGTETKLSVSRFSLLQYSSTGAVYAQEIEIKTQREITDDEHETMKESILFSDHSHEPGEIDAASENPLTSKLALLASEQEEHDEIQLIDELIAAAEGHVAPWRNRIVEAQRLADEIAVSPAEVHEHVDLDLRALLNSIKALLLRDYETSHINFETGAATLAEEGMGFISKAVAPQSMLDVLQAIKCFNLSIAERESISGMIQQNIEQDPFVTTVGGEIIHRTIVRTWPMLGLKIGTLIRDEVPSIDFIASFLEDVYPLPEKQMLKRDQDALKAQSVTRSLALLSIPQDHQDRSGDKDETTGGSEKEEDEVQEDNEIWPSQEAEQLRKRTIRRLAQELILSTTLIVKTVLPGAESESRTAKNATCAPQFQYLFQNSSLGESSPTIPLSSRCKSVLDEWKVGQNPNEYNYQLPESVAVGQGGSGTEETAEEKKEREERLLRLRQKREKRSNKTLNARKNDPGFNVSAKGSASQPAGLVVMDSEYSFSQYSADDDGFFSLPTVISASQPVVRNTGTGTGLGLSQAKSTPQPVLKKHATAFGVSASQPSSTASSSKKPLARKAERTSLGFGSQQPLSLDSAMLQPIAELSASQSESQSLSQEQDQDQSQSQSQSQEGTGLLWGASQPVPGPFANRKIAKPKKAKAKRVQGF